MSKPVIHLDIETLNQISTRLSERADSIHQFSLDDLRRDLLIAARCAELLARIRFALGEIAQKTTDHDARLELRGLLDDVSVADAGVGQR